MNETKFKEVQAIMKDFEESNLMSMELEMDGLKLRLSKNKIEKEIISEVKKEQIITPDVQINLPESVIKSPLVGTYYESDQPGKLPFVKVGQKIDKGDTVCIIEAMKIMNEIKSDVSGILEEVYFKNGEVVGFNDELFRVTTDAN